MCLMPLSGSGALGLECLSRGASFCVFCEQDKEAYRIVSQNIAALGIPKDCFALKRNDAFSLPEMTNPVFDLLFF